MADALAFVVRSVGKPWKAAKQRADREDRVSRRDLSYMRGGYSRTTIREVAFRVMEAAYMKASGNGRYPANARQIYYAARPAILAEADAESLDSQYFTQELLKSYLERRRPDWDVVFDARGHFTEPHRNGRDRQPPVGLGGAEVREYVGRFTATQVNETPIFQNPKMIATVGPALRFSGVLFIEKEGFDPILEAARIADRYDLAIASTKGMAVSACCDLLGKIGLPVYVVRDFDKAGFSIVSALRRGTRGSRSRPATVIDLGLRLADVEDLEREPVAYSCPLSWSLNLRDNGATEEEIGVLCGPHHHGPCERVELNAMTSDQFIAWLEGKLEEQGVRKVIPDTKVLGAAYRRAVFLQGLDLAQEQLARQVKADAVALPAALPKKVQRLLRDTPELSWDQAVWRLAETNGGQGTRPRSRKKTNSRRNSGRRGGPT
jgi:hypothetical protein